MCSSFEEVLAVAALEKDAGIRSLNENWKTRSYPMTHWLFPHKRARLPWRQSNGTASFGPFPMKLRHFLWSMSLFPIGGATLVDPLPPPWFFREISLKLPGSVCADEAIHTLVCPWQQFSKASLPLYLYLKCKKKFVCLWGGPELGERGCYCAISLPPHHHHLKIKTGEDYAMGKIQGTSSGGRESSLASGQGPKNVANRRKWRKETPWGNTLNSLPQTIDI